MLDFENFSASVAKVAERTRLSGSTIGNAYKTILARTSRSKTADADVSAADRSNAAAALASVGIEVYDANGAYQDFGTTLDQLSAKWGELTDAERANISEQMAGVRNLNVMNAIMDTWTDAKALAKDANEDPNFANENQEKYMERIEAKMATLQSTATQFWTGLLQTAVIGQVLDGLNSILSVASQVVGVFDKIAHAINNVAGPGMGSMITTGILGLVGGELWGGFRGLTKGSANHDAWTIDAAVEGMKSVGSAVKQVNGKKMGTFVGNGKKLYQSIFNRDALKREQESQPDNENSGALSKNQAAANGAASAHQALAASVDSASAALRGETEALTGDTNALNAESLEDSGKGISDAIQDAVEDAVSSPVDAEAAVNLTAEVSNEATEALADSVNKSNRRGLWGALTGLFGKGKNPEQKSVTEGTQAVSEGMEGIADSANRATTRTGRLMQQLKQRMPQAGTAINKVGSAIGSVGTAIGNTWKGLGLASKTAIIMAGVGAAFNGVNKIVQATTTTTDEYRQRVKEQNETYVQERKELSENEESINSILGKWHLLSNGVSKNGKNVALSNTQYKEYVEYCNQIAELLPDLAKGYDSEGNAILKVQGDISAVREAMAQKEYDFSSERINGLDAKAVNKTIDALQGQRDFNTKVGDWWDDTWAWTNLTEGTSGSREYPQMEKSIKRLMTDNAEVNTQRLLALLDKGKIQGGGTVISEGQRRAIREAYGKKEGYEFTEKDLKSMFGDLSNPDVSGVVNTTMENEMAQSIELLHSFMQDQISTELNNPDGKTKLTESAANMLSDIFTNASDDFLSRDVAGKTASEAANEYATNFMEQFQNNPEFKNLVTKGFENAQKGNPYANMDLFWNKNKKTGEVALQKAIDAIGVEGLKPQELIKQITGMEDDPDQWLDSYNTVLNSIAYAGSERESAQMRYFAKVERFDKNGQRYQTKKTRYEKASYKNNEKVLRNLKNQNYTLDDINAMLMNNNIETADQLAKLNEIMAIFEGLNSLDPFKKAMINWDAMSYDPDEMSGYLDGLKDNVEVVKETRKNVNEAWKESYSASGMSTEAIDNVRAYAKQIRGDGYDENDLLEKTGTGVRLNVAELRKLNAEYKKNELGKYEKTMNSLQDAYHNNLKAMRDDRDGQTQTQEAYEATNKALLQQMNDLDTYRSQVKGMFSKVNLWDEAQSMGESGDLYDSIQGNIKTVTELWDKGLTGTNKLRTFVDMFTADDLEGADNATIVAHYEEAMKKANRYFTEGGEGAEAFLNDVQALNKGWAELNDDGSWSIDFPDHGILADALGIDESVIDVMIGKLRDYGAELKYINESAMEKNFRQKGEKNAEGLDEATLKEYHIGSEATEAYTGINDKGDITNMQQAKKAAKEYGEKLDEVSEKLYDLQQKKKKSDADEAEIKRLEQLKDSLTGYKEYLDEVIESEQRRQKSYKTAEGQKNLNANIADLQKEQIISANFKVDWNYETAGYYKDKINELKSELEASGVMIDGKIDFSNTTPEAKAKLMDIINQLSLAAAEKKIKVDLPFDFNGSNVVEGASETTRLAKLQLQQIVEQITLLDQMEIKEKEFGIEVKDSDKQTVVDTINNLVDQLGSTTTIPIPAEVKTALAEGDISAFVAWCQSNPAMLEILANMGFKEEVESWTPEEKTQVIQEQYKEDKNKMVNTEEKTIPVRPVMIGGDLSLDQTGTLKLEPVINVPSGGYDQEGTLKLTVAPLDTSIVDSIQLQDKVVKAHLDSTEIDSYSPPEYSAVEIAFKKNSSVVDNYKPKAPSSPTVKFNKDSSAVDRYNPSNLTRSVTYYVKTVGTLPGNRTGTATVKAPAASKTSTPKTSKVSSSQRNAINRGIASKRAWHNGTATTGKAYASGDWGIKKPGVSLVGEEGYEIVSSYLNMTGDYKIY